MTGKKSVRRWEAIAVVLATLFTIFCGSYSLAVSQAASINNALGLQGASVSRSDDAAYIYFPSAYADAQSLETAYLAVCEEVEGEGIVLLKNENGALPLSADEKISCFLTGSVNFNYSASGSSAADTSAYSTLKDAFTGVGLAVNEDLWNWYGSCGYGRTKKGSNYLINEAPWSEIPENVTATIGDYPTAVVTLVRDSGEGKDINAKKSDSTDGSYLTLSEQEAGVLARLTELKREGKVHKIIVLLNSSATLQLDFLQDENIEVDACVWVGNVGKAGIRAVAGVLSGKVNPSGRLSDTFLIDNLSGPASAFLNLNKKYFSQYYADFEEEGLNATQMYYGIYAEGIYVGYRYYETRYTDYVLGTAGAGEYAYAKDVAWPFGFGLSYTDFEYSGYQVAAAPDGKSYDVTVTVRNAGSIPGKEAVLIWLQKPYTDYDREKGVEKAAVELAGFTKTGLLASGASETVTVNVPRESFKSYDAEGHQTYIVEPGSYVLTAARDAHEAANNFLAAQGVTAAVNGRMDADGRADMVGTVTVDELDLSYAVSASTGSRITNQLSFADVNRYEGLKDYSVTYVSRNDWEGTWPRELVNLTIENDTFRADIASGKPIPDDGAAMPVYGEQNGRSLADLRGLPYDSEYWDSLLNQMTWEEQAYLVTNAQFTTVAVPSVSKPETYEDDGPIGVVSSTAKLSMPCEGIWASTFNKDLFHAVGGMLAEDARASGKTGLYASGVNIHRTPFGGRSAEYFSEDPFLSGVASMHEVKGMQEKGVIAHVKHFAFNDEESERNGICIWLNEQEAREIMLVPFQYSLAADQGNAHAVMSGFNRVGTDWAGANRNLLMNILHGEWGFDGYCITDMASSNGAIYMTYKDGLPRGTDCYLGSGSASALDEFKNDPSFAARVREASHRILYAVANYSCAMNGLSGESLVSTTTPWWQTALLTAIIALAVLTAGALAMWGMSWKKARRNASAA